MIDRRAAWAAGVRVGYAPWLIIAGVESLHDMGWMWGSLMIAVGTANLVEGLQGRAKAIAEDEGDRRWGRVPD